MIAFTKKSSPQPVPHDAEENRFEQIRKAAKDMHRKSDTDGNRRRVIKKAEDNRLI